MKRIGHVADREAVKTLSPSAMRRRAGQLEEEGLELCRRATALRGHADRILQERRDQRAANQRANRTI